MHWIDRGPEPDGVAKYSQQFTPGWIDYFQNKVGERPSDFLWSLFRPGLGIRSSNICWYCERQCDEDSEVGGLAPTVDHFRPIRDILNKPFLLETCRTWQRRGRRPRSGRSLPPLSPLRLVPDRASGSLVQAGRLAGKAAGRTTPSVVPPPPAGCPGRTATPGAPCSWPAPGSAPCRIRTAASTAGTDAPL